MTAGLHHHPVFRRAPTTTHESQQAWRDWLIRKILIHLPPRLIPSHASCDLNLGIVIHRAPLQAYSVLLLSAIRLPFMQPLHFGNFTAWAPTCYSPPTCLSLRRYLGNFACISNLNTNKTIGRMRFRKTVIYVTTKPGTEPSFVHSVRYLRTQTTRYRTLTPEHPCASRAAVPGA